MCNCASSISSLTLPGFVWLCIPACADGTAFAVWRCLLLPDSRHRQEDPSPQQLLQLLCQLRRSPERGSNSNRNAAAAAAAGGNSSRTHTEQQQQQQPDTHGCIWVLLMLRGGHFAAAVVRINSNSSSSSAQQPTHSLAAATESSQQQQQRPRIQQPGPAVEPFQVLAHKTLHRYVVR